MRFITVLNALVHYKGFSFGDEVLNRKTMTMVVKIHSHKGSLVPCPECGRRCTVYDHQPARRYDFEPYMDMKVKFEYAPRRADCPKCGRHTEQVPWARGKSPVTIPYAWTLAMWAKRLPWKQVAEAYGCGWHAVYNSVSMAVEWGLAHRVLEGVKSIGVDEVDFGLKLGYRTLVYQLCGAKTRLIAIAEGHKEEAFAGILDKFGTDWCAKIEHVCSDMWKAYLAAARKRLPNAMHILDRFHIDSSLNKAVDTVRKEESKSLAKKGLQILKNMKYAFLKRPENLTDQQREAIQSILNKRNLKTVRAYGWKESFRPFWEYEDPDQACRYLRKWCRGAKRSRLPPIKKFAETMTRHEHLILNWFKAKKQFSSGPVEAMNRGAGLVSNLARGYKNPKIMEIALFHALGDLPTPPEFTHRFS